MSAHAHVRYVSSDRDVAASPEPIMDAPITIVSDDVD
jgi:hypothetical protein